MKIKLSYQPSIKGFAINDILGVEYAKNLKLISDMELIVVADLKKNSFRLGFYNLSDSKVVSTSKGDQKVLVIVDDKGKKEIFKEADIRVLRFLKKEMPLA